MATVPQRAAEILAGWEADCEQLDEACHFRTGCWFYALALAYYERGNHSRAGSYAQLALAAWHAPTAAHSLHGP